MSHLRDSTGSNDSGQSCIGREMEDWSFI